MRRLGPLFWIVGIACLAAASVRAARGGGVVIPAWPAVVLAGGLLGLSQLAGLRGWLSLLGDAAPADRLRAGFFAAQLGKYIPGGIWLGAGQVGLAVQAGVPVARATGALTVYGVCLAAAAAALAGAFAPLLPELPVWLRLAGPAGLLSLALLDRRWMAALATRLGRRLVRGSPHGLVPAQRAIVAAAGWGAAAILGSAAAFAVIVAGSQAPASAAAVLGAFVVAWLGGYLVLGLPSGIGAREAILVATLGAVPAAEVLAACLTHRLVQMAIEAALVLATRHRLSVPARFPTRTDALPRVAEEAACRPD